ncbi:MAG TPA: hypothetical protein VF584_19530 [Longimicrobium sp.]|jgi:hypothetical protein
MHVLVILREPARAGLLHPHDAARVMAADCLCFRARRVSRALTRMYGDALRPLGIQATQLTLLNAVTMCGGEGASMARLADKHPIDDQRLNPC